MIITTQNIDEFLECLQEAESIFDNTVRVSIVKKGKDGDQRNAIVFEIVLQASTVVEVDEDASYLLTTGQFCGKDYEEDPPQRDGSETAALLKSKIKEYAASRGWRVLPGIIDT